MEKIQTHYDNLQISRIASDTVIRAAYRGLSQQYHPDKNPERPEEAERVMKILNEAYAVLSDPVRRKQHDEWIDSQERNERRDAPAATHQSSESDVPPNEVIVRLKRGVAIGYFLFGVAILIFALSAWFSPLGVQGWTGYAMGIPDKYWQLFERFIGVPLGLMVNVYYMRPLYMRPLLSGTIMIVNSAGIRFSDSGGQMFPWREISYCKDNGTHIVLGGFRNNKKWEKWIISSTVAYDLTTLIQMINQRIHQDEKR